VESDGGKASIQGQISVLEDKMRLKDTEVRLLQDELTVKKHAAIEQDAEVGTDENVLVCWSNRTSLYLWMDSSTTVNYDHLKQYMVNFNPMN